MFVNNLLARNARILSKIYYNTSFNKQLVAGTLPRDLFKFYLEQDALYLHDFSKTLKIIASRFTELRYKQQFGQLSDQIISAELNIHLRYLRTTKPGAFFTLSSQRTIKKIPVISNYTEHLLATANTAPIEVAVANVIPCFAIYNELGLILNASCEPNNPYCEWIRSYSSAWFTSSTNSLKQTMNELAHKNPCPILHAQINSSFSKSVEFELMFFEAVLAQTVINSIPNRLRA